MSLSQKLIQEVKTHPEIWQRSNRLYKYKTARARAWKAMAKAMGKDEQFIRKRWKNLKDVFRKELKKLVMKELDEPQWQHFEELSFITEDTLKRIVKSKSDIQDDKEVSDERNVNDDFVDHENDPLTVKLAATSSTSMSYDSPNIESKSQTTLARNIQNIAKQLQNDTANEEEMAGDADYLFLVSILPTLKKLTYVQKLQFRGKVNQWLLEAVAPDYCNDYEKTNDDFS